MKSSEFLSRIENLDTGSHRLNHNWDGCSGSSKSMMVTVNADGSVFGYCHRCGQKYSTRPISYTGLKAPSCLIETRYGEELSLPIDSQYIVALWPSEAAVWLYRSRIDQGLAGLLGLVYSEEHGRVLIPYFDKGKLVFFQSRKVHAEDEGPKYLSQSVQNACVYKHLRNGDRSVVIVEDALSAARLYKFVSSFSILGVNLKDNQLSKLISLGYKRYFVWLDNDSLVVKNKARQIKNKLDLVGNTKIVLKNKEPKQMSDDELYNSLIELKIL